MRPTVRRSLLATTLLVALLVLAPGFGRSIGMVRRAPGEELPATPLGPYRAGMDLREAYESFPPAGRARIVPLLDNGDAWRARWRLLAGAGRRVDLSTFILDEDVFGVAFLGHLLARARDGVEVRVLVDAVGTQMSTSLTGRDAMDDVAASPGVTLRRYRPLPTRAVDTLLSGDPAAAIASDHDKILVVDGASSVLGGRNVARDYFGEPGVAERTYRDVDLLLESPDVAAVVTRSFEVQYDSEQAAPSDEDEEAGDEASLRRLELAYRTMDAWLREGELSATLERELEDAGVTWGEDVRRHPELAGSLGDGPRDGVDAEVRILDSTARFGTSDPISEGLARLVRSSRREILVATPYLVLSRRAVDLLADAAARGVRIVVLTNSPVSSDNALSQAFFLEQWPELLAAVPTMRLYVSGERDTLHAKCAAIDGELALVSTYNLEPVSMSMNGEIMAAAWSEELAETIGRLVTDATAGEAPRVYEYRILRDRRGEVVLEDGRPVVAFGPRDHCSPEQWKTMTALRTMIRAVEDVAGLGPLF